EAGDAAGAVVDLQELAGGVRQAGELRAGPGRRDAVAVGVLDVVHPAVAAEAGHQAVRLAEDEDAAAQSRQRGGVAGLGEVAPGGAAVRLEAAFAAVDPRDDHRAVRFGRQRTVPAVGPGPAPAERPLVVAADRAGGEDAGEGDRQARRVHLDVGDAVQGR